MLVILAKKTHKKLFKNVLKQIKSVNKVHKQDNILDYDKCKKLHKILFNNVLIELISTNNAGHKDSSANNNETCAHDIQYKVDEVNNNLLHNHILYYFNKIKKIEKALSEHNKHILTSLNKKYSDNRVKLNEFKKVNDKLNLLLECICLFMFNKKIKKESIVENVNVLNNINEHTALIDNKRVCLGDIHEYLYENINDIRTNIKNKEYEKVLTDLLLIQKHTFMSINRMHPHNVNKKITDTNKKINNNTNKNDMNSTTKNSNKRTNANKKINNTDKITNANNANEKSTNANNINKKITNANNTNEKITNANNANKKIINTNNANEKSTNGNSANNNSTNAIKKSPITIRLKRPHVIY